MRHSVDITRLHLFHLWPPDLKSMVHFCPKVHQNCKFPAISPISVEDNKIICSQTNTNRCMDEHWTQRHIHEQSENIILLALHCSNSGATSKVSLWVASPALSGARNDTKPQWLTAWAWEAVCHLATAELASHPYCMACSESCSQTLKNDCLYWCFTDVLSIRSDEKYMGIILVPNFTCTSSCNIQYLVVSEQSPKEEGCHLIHHLYMCVFSYACTSRFLFLSPRPWLNDPMTLTYAVGKSILHTENKVSKSSLS